MEHNRHAGQCFSVAINTQTEINGALIEANKMYNRTMDILLPMYKLVEYFDILVQLETCLHFFVKRTYKLSKLLMFGLLFIISGRK